MHLKLRDMSIGNSALFFFFINELSLIAKVFSTYWYNRRYLNQKNVLSFEAISVSMWL